MRGFWDQLVPGVGTMLLIITTLERVFPEYLLHVIKRILRKLSSVFITSYVEITFEEFPSEEYTRSKAYAAIETYLGTNFSVRAERLKGNARKGSHGVNLSMDDYEEITEVYKGAKVWWMRSKNFPRSNVISLNPGDEEKRSYVLSFQRQHRDLITGPYLSYVLSEGKAIAKRNRRQRLYTNVSHWSEDKKSMWSHVPFEHPATFSTLAMDPDKKKEIVDDLVAFSKAKEYYGRIGKAWKRGYLLYGPPGTGKSTMIAAMANFLHYDVYDLELTAVRDNLELRKLLMEISKRAIVVIEDVDCSLDLTGNRTKNNEYDLKGWKEVVARKLAAKNDANHRNDEDSKVTLSGLLNFIDGLWSACGGERIIVFTTNHVDKLDPALIRRGRMDKHIEMSYCCFEAFKVLAKNYLKLESHDMFDKVKCLLQETNMTPADVAENLMPKSADMGAQDCLENLVLALKVAKDEARKPLPRKGLKTFGGTLLGVLVGKKRDDQQYI